MRLGTNRAEEVRQDLIAASQLLVHLLVSRLTYLLSRSLLLHTSTFPSLTCLFTIRFSPFHQSLWHCPHGKRSRVYLTLRRPSVRLSVCLSRGNSE